MVHGSFDMHSVEMAFSSYERVNLISVETRIKMPDNMLREILGCLLLYNTVADKHILMSVFIFARGTKCSGDASFFF